MTIGIVQPDSGNIRSVCDALERLARPYKLLPKPDLTGISQLLIPGQGRFGAVMNYLEANQWRPVLKQWAAQQRPLLGICVGMQILFERSEEDPEVPGLGIFPGRVVKMPALKLPMIGWAPVRWTQEGYPQGAAYFVNSYAVVESDYQLASVTHGAPFCAAVKNQNTVAFQFHPEKSGKWGKELLDKCLTY